MGSEDFAFYLDKVPGSMFFLGTKNEKKGATHPPHSPYYVIDEDIFPIGAALHATFAYSFLSDSAAKLHLHLWESTDILLKLPQLFHWLLFNVDAHWA